MNLAEKRKAYAVASARTEHASKHARCSWDLLVVAKFACEGSGMVMAPELAKLLAQQAVLHYKLAALARTLGKLAGRADA